MGKSAKEWIKGTANKVWAGWKAATIPGSAFQTVASQEFAELASVGVALTHNFNFVIERTKGTAYIDNSGKSKSKKADSSESGNIGDMRDVMKLNDISVPDIGLQFQNVAETGYQVNAMISELAPIVVRYWDTADLKLTKKITQLYKDQFDDNNLLLIGYNQYQVTMTDNGRKLTLLDCAITKPHYDNMTAQLGLKMFSFQVTYEDYKEEFIQ